MRGSPASHDPGGSSAGIVPAGVSTSRQRPRACSCGWSQTSCIVLTRAFAICASSSRATTCSAVSGANAATISARSSSRAALRRELVANRSCARELRLQQHLLAERDPFALVLQPEHHRLAVARGERTVRVDRRVARPGARRRRRAFERVVEREAHPLDERLEHRDVDVLPAPGLAPLQQRGEDARVRVHAGGDVGDRQAGLRRLLLGAGDGQEPGLALDQQVVRLPVAIRAVAAVARDVADDDAGLLRRKAPRTRGRAARPRPAPGSGRRRRPARGSAA